MIKLITYTDHRMTISARECMESALFMGAHLRYIYTPDDLEFGFKSIMGPVLKEERGAGFYCWKPYVCYRALEGMKYGDYLIWSDAGTTWIEPLSLLTDALDKSGEDILFFSNGWPHADWCKMDCLSAMLRGENYNISKWNNVILRETKQVQASQIVFRVNINTKRLITDWLEWTLRIGMIDNNASVMENILTFQEHRWDQSILTNLQIIHNYKLHWFPSTYGHHLPRLQPEDTYPAMFEHHRRRNDEW